MAHFRFAARAAVRQLLLGPQILAFVPALSLCAYWFGGEVLLLTVALVLPATLALISLLNPVATVAPPRDSVTGLPLASHAADRLDTHFAASDSRRIAAFAIEIDGLNEIQARFGMTAADDILNETAERLAAALRPGDLLTRRTGGGFVAVVGPVRTLDLEAAIQIAARLQAALEPPLTLGATGLHTTLCIGFCLPRRRFEMCGEGCIAGALSGLQEAQAAGPGSIRTFVPRTPQARSAGTDIAALGEELAQAFDAGQIEPWFQPQISTDTGRVSGIEALVRWNHPRRGIVEPAQFLGAVAAAGLQRRLSETMLRRGLDALAGWDGAGLAVPAMSVNFSGADLADPMLSDRIGWELDRTGLAPARLSVEILETVIARGDDDAVTRSVARLAQLGCRIELDDFGTGHAAIANIRRFKVSRIKIDRSFVSRVDVDGDQRQMLAAILDMAERLGIETIAEGVETAGEHALLGQLGCQHVQGYSIARPMPLAAATEWLSRQAMGHDPSPLRLPRTG
ncbi:putative bifunctional diguanylate cyclase/phosphodiesterase [Anianabacter salinae]|uniref:putative bifunctional diguanylate cyclase/phosphodiesterase n=1 Tax=Anianabacter salinae TaxID=2851023 RepID=UPI00225E4529|nr:GGDEF domain-containing phosphodiesterase [Anianabacter salinae]MBV0913109.1 GGDEF domain-containing phosphodiesterase [Anianabacter salinae]